MKTKILSGVVVVLVIGLAAGAFWWLRRPQVITFSDDSKVTLLAVEYGKRHAVPAAKAPAASTKARTPVRRGANSFTTTNDTLVLWVRQEYDATQNQFHSFQYCVYDKAETACMQTFGRNYGNGRQGSEIVAVQIDAFPRRQGKFIVRVQEQGNGGQEMSDQKFVIANPVRGSFANWTAEPLPATKSDDDLSVTLTKLVAGADAPINRNQDNPDDAMNKGRETLEKLERQGSEAMMRLEVIRSSAADTEHKAQEMLQSIEAQMPVFTQMDRVINAAVEQLQHLFSEPDTLTDLYDTILPADRQRITYYERSVAGLEFAELPQLKTKLANIYRGLAVFYAWKCFRDLAQLKDKEWPDGPDVERIRNKEDLTRARLYAEMARAKSENPFCVENDLGWMASLEGDLGLAAEHFRRSLALHPCQQRALTNLGIAQLRQNNLTEATVSLKQAKQFDLWETGRRDLKSRVHYNLACALVRQAAQDTTQEHRLLGEALSELQEMIKYNTCGLLRSFDLDLKEDGDLWLLASRDSFAPGMASIRRAMLCDGS